MIAYTQFLHILQKLSNRYLTIHFRPVSATNIGVLSDPIKPLPLCAIILQGPIKKEDDFTLETTKLYKKTMPGALIIISTWPSKDQAYIKKFSKIGVHVIENDYPPSPYDKFTINLQITSTLAGILFAKGKKAKYILKTRTDQRLYGTSIIEFCHNALQLFPVAKGFKQKQRIIAPSFYTFKYRMYSVTDMVLFGKIEDMMKYFSPPFDDRPIINKIGSFKIASVRELCKLRLGEIYLSTEFLKKVGRKLRWTLKDSWSAYADHFCIVDQGVFDIYWAKYDCFNEFRHVNYSDITNKQELTFKEWLNLYTGIQRKRKIPEKTLDEAIDARAVIS